MNGLLTAAILLAWGAQAVVPWSLRRLPRTADPADLTSADIARVLAARRQWSALALPLLFGAALAALWVARSTPDAVVAAGMAPFLSSLPGRLLTLMLAALFAADSILALGREKVENLGWLVAAGLGLLFLGAVSLAAELIRIGESERGTLPLLFAAAGCRLLVALGAGEALAAGRPKLALAAGLALPLYLLCLPGELRHVVLAGGHWLTLGAAAVLFLAARWLPVSLRRPTIVAAVLLAGLFFDQTVHLSQGLPLEITPMGPLPVP